jgi:glucokinase
MAHQSDADDILKFPILIGDIGGTNARFALLVDPHAEPKSFDTVQTRHFATIEDAIQAAVLDKTSLLPRTAVIAVAGPVAGDAIKLTNCDWTIKPRDMISGLGLEDVIVLNDFEAQALAVVGLGEDDVIKLGGGEPRAFGSRAVLGPGTGLGVAGLVHARHCWIPVPGEGGHIDVGARSPREHDVFPHLEAIDGRISAEQVLCGSGLVNIYRAVCAANGAVPHLAPPPPAGVELSKEEVAAQPERVGTAAQDGSDANAAEALRLFVVLLGRVAGDMGLVFMARGGVFLAGGISQKILPALRDPSFRAAFEDKAPHSGTMREIPVYVVTHPTAALSGLSSFARTPARFGVVVEGRRWRA